MSFPMPESSAVISVSELNRLARQALEREFPLQWVAGEVSNLTRAASGHVYFTLKDAGAQARCVMFRSRAQSLPWRLENGQQVEARALVSLYEPRGDYQLNVEGLRRAGQGRLYEAFARLKARLEGEGLFAAARKRPLPPHPAAIGIVSSPQAAALRDVLAALRRRAPHVRVILYPTPVQGEGAGERIAAALATAGARAEAELVLLVRGGGSIEDLWSFNEEGVARAIAASPLPVVSGVGHETDLTIADFVADLRAATPTAAAELATQGWVEARHTLRTLAWNLNAGLTDRLARWQQALDQAAARLVHPARRLEQGRDRLRLLETRLRSALARETTRQRAAVDRLGLRLGRAAPLLAERRGRLRLLAQRLDHVMAGNLGDRRHRLAAVAAALNHLNPRAILARGFAIVRDEDGRVLTDAASLVPGQTAMVDLARGHARVRIVDSTPESRLE